jgi:hypothetical protein
LSMRPMFWRRPRRTERWENGMRLLESIGAGLP